METKTKKKIEKVKLQNVGEIYRSDDKELGANSILVKPQQEWTFSKKKALQVVNSFPLNWAFIDAETDDTKKEFISLLSKRIFETKTHQKHLSQRNTNVNKPKVETKYIEKPTDVDIFVNNVRSNKTTKVVIENEIKQIITVIREDGFVGANTYISELVVEDNELGSNVKTNVRYFLKDLESVSEVETKGDSKTTSSKHDEETNDEETNDEETEETNDEETNDEETEETNDEEDIDFGPSGKDVDIEGAPVDDLMSDLTDEEKNPKPKKRKRKRSNRG